MCNHTFSQEFRLSHLKLTVQAFRRSYLSKWTVILPTPVYNPKRLILTGISERLIVFLGQVSFRRSFYWRNKRSTFHLYNTCANVRERQSDTSISRVCQWLSLKIHLAALATLLHSLPCCRQQMLVLGHCLAQACCLPIAGRLWIRNYVRVLADRTQFKSLWRDLTLLLLVVIEPDAAVASNPYEWLAWAALNFFDRQIGVFLALSGLFD